MNSIPIRCIYTRFPPSTLLSVGYSIRLKKSMYVYIYIMVLVVIWCVVFYMNCITFFLNMYLQNYKLVKIDTASAVLLFYMILCQKISSVRLSLQEEK